MRYPRCCHLGVRDLVLALALTVAAAGWSWFGSGLIGPQMQSMTFANAWFDADAPQVIRSITNIGAYHRTNKHPLFLPIAYPPIKALRLLGLDHFTAVRVVVAGWAALFAALLFLTLRASLPLHGAAAFTALGLSTSAFLFWAPIPETLMLGSVAILCSLAVVAWRDRLTHSVWLIGLANVLTLGVTTLNWIGGLMASLVALKPRRAVIVSAGAFAFVAVVAVAHSAALPTSGLFFVPSHLSGEVDYLKGTAESALLPKWRGLLLHAGAFPTPARSATGLATQPSSAAPLAWLWLGVVAAGLASFARQDRALVATVVAVLGSQMVFHAFFGSESFLFSIHALPGLILMASWSFTRWPRAAFIGCLTLAGLLAVQNVGRFLESAEITSR